MHDIARQYRQIDNKDNFNPGPNNLGTHTHLFRNAEKQTFTQARAPPTSAMFVPDPPKALERVHYIIIRTACIRTLRLSLLKLFTPITTSIRRSRVARDREAAALGDGRVALPLGGAIIAYKALHNTD